jgi:hypothetical protein
MMEFNRADFNEWLKQFGKTISVPMSLMADRRIRTATRDIYVAVLCLPDPHNFTPQDLVSDRFNIHQVKRGLATLRKYGYLPDEV